MGVTHWIQCSRCFGFVYCHEMLKVHNLVNGKIALFVSTVIVSLQTVHTDYFTALLNEPVYFVFMQKWWKIFHCCINSIIEFNIKNIFDLMTNCWSEWVRGERDMHIIFFLQNICSTCTKIVHIYYYKLVHMLMLAMLSFRTMSVIWSVWGFSLC